MYRILITTCRAQNPDIPRAGRGGPAHGEAAGRDGVRWDETLTIRSAQETTDRITRQDIENNCSERIFGEITKDIPC